MRCRAQNAALALLAALLAVGTAQADEGRHRVAVLPVSLLAASPATGERVRARLSESLAGHAEVELLAPAQIDAAVRVQCGDREAWWDCLEQEENLLGVGKRLGAGAVVASNLAVMGDTRVLKLRVLDLSTETVSGEVVEMVGANDEAVLERFLALNQRLFPQEESPPPWYQRWEIWTIVGTGAVVVAAAATVAAVYIATAGGGEEESWDAQVSLP